jgi:hypothetical protein
VYDKIMESLPEASPSMATPWWRKPFGLSPAMIAAIGAGMLALGIAIGALVK